MDNEVITRTNNGWQWDKKINIFSIVALILALTGWVFAISERVTVNEHAIANQAALVAVQIQAIKDFDTSQSSTQKSDQLEIIRRLERIEDGVNQHIQATAGILNGIKDH